MALSDFLLDDLIDLAESGLARMRTSDELDRLQGFSTLVMVMPFLRAAALGGEPNG